MKGREDEYTDSVIAMIAPLHEEGLVLTMDGPFEQKTGGKGANAAAAAGQTFACELVANMGGASAEQNAMLRRDLAAFGGVGTQFTSVLEGTPTGTAGCVGRRVGGVGGATRALAQAHQRHHR